MPEQPITENKLKTLIPFDPADPSEEKTAWLDPQALVTSRLLIQAASGGGKSRMLRYLLEQTFGLVPHIVFDTEGEFVSLREQFAYLLAGKGGEVPAHPSQAALLCRRIVDIGASIIIDLSDLKRDAQRGYVNKFVTELMELGRQYWKPFFIVIDEAHLYCPERGSGESVSTEAIVGLCSQGRKRGFCAILATQRLSKLHKDAAAELANKLIGRTTLDVDLRRAGDDLGLEVKARNSLKELSPGTFYAFGPAFDFGGVRLIRSLSVSTTHPEPGTITPPPPPTPEAIRELAKALADLPAAVEEEETARATAEAWKNFDRTPEQMQVEIDTLRSQLQKKVTPRTTAPAAGSQPAVVYLAESDRAIIAGFTAAAEKIAGMTELLERLQVPSPVPKPAANKPVAAPAAPVVQFGVFTPEEMRVMVALASYPHNRLRRTQLSALASLTEGDASSIWGLTLVTLQKRNCLAWQSPHLILTSHGKLALASATGKPVPTPPASCLDVWKEHLPKKTWEILQFLVEIRPKTATRAVLGRRFNLNPMEAGLRGHLKKLADLELIHRDIAKGRMRAMDDL